MNIKFKHLETSVCQLKRNSKILRDQNAYLTKQINELKSSVSKLESQNKEKEIKRERLEGQSWRDTLRFYGLDDKSDDKSDEPWEDLETRVRNYIHEHLNIDEVSIQIERAHHIPGKQSSQPIIVKFSHYKDSGNFLKKYCEKRKDIVNKPADNPSNEEDVWKTFVSVRTFLSALLE